MAKQPEVKHRGLFERPPGSGIWWILYYADGRRRREKVGRKSDAIDLYRIRKADSRRGEKIPELRIRKAVTLANLIDDAIEFTADHKDHRSYVSKGAIVKAALGGIRAADLTPQELERWLREHCKTAATSNRYKAFFSLCYREGIRNEKASNNPARQVRIRREGAGRIRYLTRDEYDALCAIIAERFPKRLAEFVVSVNTGMRLSEQYTLAWSQVHFDRRTIDLTETKNGTSRTIHMNSDVVKALEQCKAGKVKASARVFPRLGPTFDTRSWFVPCLADAKIKSYVWHSNRHTFCSWLAMAGATIKEIQELAGHKTITMSARYSHLSPAHRLSVVERISSTATTTATEPKQDCATA
jgi:integrase